MPRRSVCSPFVARPPPGRRLLQALAAVPDNRRWIRCCRLRGLVPVRLRHRTGGFPACARPTPRVPASCAACGGRSTRCVLLRTIGSSMRATPASAVAAPSWARCSLSSRTGCRLGGAGTGSARSLRGTRLGSRSRAVPGATGSSAPLRAVVARACGADHVGAGEYRPVVASFPLGRGVQGDRISGAPLTAAGRATARRS